MELYCIINLESNTKNWEEEVEFNFKTRVDYFFCWLFLLSAMQCHLDEPKFVQSVMMSIYSADNILWCCQCQWLPFERPQHETTARWYQNRKKTNAAKKSGNIFFECLNLWISLSSLDALLKASWSKFVFDFEKFNIPSNFYWFTKEKQRVKWKIETWNVILQLTKIKCAVKVIQQMTKYNLL